MPRKKKKDAPKTGGKVSQRDRDIANYWTQQIHAAQKVKADYANTACQIKKYLRADHSELFSDPATSQHFMSFEGATAISVPKIAQMRNSLGPRLYQAKPVRTVTSTSDDGVMLGLSRVLQAYLNYTVKETKFPKQLRKAIDDGLVRGRCFLQQIWDGHRGLVYSKYLSSRDVLFDPDHDDIENARWVAVRHREPRWETDRRVTEKWRIKNLTSETAQSDHHAGKGDELEEGDEARKVPTTSDTVTYWVVLSRMGAGFRGADMKGKKRRRDSNDFVRLEIVLDHEVPLAEGEWDVPLYLDKEWPISYVDFIEPIDEPWPESMSGQVLPCQMGIDLLTSVRMTGAKNRDRLILLVDSVIEDLAKEQFRSGSSADMISIRPPQGKRLADVIHVPQFGPGSPESARERDFLIEQIETTTGVTSVLHGGQDSGAVERSATASQQRGGAADARLADLEQKRDELVEDAARKEALILRLAVPVEEIEPFVQPSALELFFVNIEVPGSGVIPVRDTRPPEERAESPESEVITLEAIFPLASNYFETQEEAFEMCHATWEMMATSEDPRVIQLAENLAGQGLAPEDGLPMGIQPAPVTAARVWEDTAGISPEELVRELSYEIASGSSGKINKQAEQANAESLIQTALPAMISVGDYDGANKLFEIMYEAFEVPQDQRVFFTAPPPPPTMGEGQPEEEEGPPSE